MIRFGIRPAAADFRQEGDDMADSRMSVTVGLLVPTLRVGTRLSRSSAPIAAMVCVAVALWSWAALGQQPAAEDAGHGRLLAEIRQRNAGLAIWWTGHNGWLVKANGVLIGTDLVVDDPGRRAPRRSPPPNWPANWISRLSPTHTAIISMAPHRRCWRRSRAACSCCRGVAWIERGNWRYRRAGSWWPGPRAAGAQGPQD